MGADRLVFTNVSKPDIVERLEKSGIAVELRHVTSLLNLLVVVGDPDDEIDEIKAGAALQSDAFGLIVPNTHFNVNVRRASVIVAAAILDAVLTAGLASSMLAISGLAKQGVAKLDTGSGEFCCLVQTAKLVALGGKVGPTEVFNAIHGNSCPFIELRCRLMVESICNADLKNVDALFEGLRDKGALEHRANGWEVPL